MKKTNKIGGITRANNTTKYKVFNKIITVRKYSPIHYFIELFPPLAVTVATIILTIFFTGYFQ
jgi:hypothetical protein